MTKARITQLLGSLLVAGALCWVAMEPAGPPPAAAAQELQAQGKRKPPAVVAANATLQPTGNVAIAIRSNAKKVALKYRTAKGKLRVRYLLVRKNAARASLPSGARRIKVRANGTTKLRASAWLALETAPSPAPWISTSPPPRTSTPTVKPSTTPGASQSPSATHNQTPNPTQSGSPSPAGTTPAANTLSAADLREIASLRVFFGHQSVGANVLDGIAPVFATHSVPAPTVNSGAPRPGGSFGNAFIGSNYDPVSKINSFDDWIRTGGAANSDVAFMKLCYVDVTVGRDLDAWFNLYRSKMAALEADYPQVTFLHVTNPLTSGEPADNLVRERLNTMMRAQYAATGRLFDLALIESTKPDGSRVSGVHGGQTYYALYGGYTTDGGHLNDAGARRAAAELLRVIARAR